ncbi:MAG: substrate-binding domain-containing protein [Sphaerochaetaceae bacterium]|nr:substrate-binding domain-containing protein [Sphaerochaetaceae bacterium]
MKNWRIVSVSLFITVCLAFTLSASGASESASDEIVIGISVIGAEHNWDINAYNGAQDRAKELGMKVLAFDGERRPEKQISDVKSLIARKVDVIAVILGDVESLSPVLKEARDAGIPVVTADFENPYTLSNVSTDNRAAMAALVEQMVADMNQKGEVGIFYTPGIPVAELRYEVFTGVLDRYPQVKVVAQEAWQFPNVTPDAYEKSKDMLTAHPEIDAFWTVFDMPMIGAAQAIADKGMQADVKTYGFDGDPTAMKMIQDPDSAYAATVAQQPYIIGQKLAEVAKQVVAGESVEKEIYVDHILVTRDNVDEVFNSLPQYK